MTKIAGFRSGSESGSISQRHRSADLGSGCTPKSHGIRNIGTGNKEQWGGTRLQMYPTAYWKVQEDDTPARTVKTIVHTLVKVRFRLRQHLPIVCSSVSDSIRSVDPDLDPGGQKLPTQLKNVSAVNFYTFLIIKTLYPDRYSALKRWIRIRFE